MAPEDYTLAYLIVISFIVIYYCCACRTRDSNDASSLPPSSTPPPLDAAAMITIYHRTPTETNEESLECTICLEVIKEGEKVKVLLSCCHCYHCECIDKWLIANSSCPMCRTSVPVDSPV
ncbi:unnamed protein product [Lactuca virosa]|uniref:RING-type E3 ubiquitin transferase n=1 Tax=Lactuca virosa TaxID=75947 RepID=A0AAU9NM28_9ASTR|nr:unnamed protein product [Lactuca virosa]